MALVWVVNPGADPAQWTLVGLSVVASGGYYRVSGDTVVTVGGVRLRVPDKATVTLAPDGTGIDIKIDSAVSAGNATFGLVGPGGADIGAVARTVTLPLTGVNAGCLIVSLTATTEALAGLKAGCAFHRGATVLEFPILCPDASDPVAMTAILDPLGGTGPGRSVIQVASGSRAPSGYRTLRGAAVTLTATTDDDHPNGPLLVFDGDGLTLSGPFAVATPAGDATILCGLNGRETLTPGGAGFTFVPGGARKVWVQVTGATADTVYADGAQTFILAADAPPVPLVPYGGTTASVTDCQGLESEQMAPARAALLTPVPNRRRATP